MQRYLFTLVFCFMAVAGLNQASAQISLEVGPRVGYDIGGDIDEVFLGVDARLGVVALPVDFGASFDYYLMEEGISFTQFGINAYYNFPLIGAPVVPYVGAGIGISRISYDFGDEFNDWFGPMNTSSSDTGINLIGGARFPLGNVIPFAQAQFTIGDFDLFTIGGGLLIPIGL